MHWLAHRNQGHKRVHAGTKHAAQLGEAMRASASQPAPDSRRMPGRQSVVAFWRAVKACAASSPSPPEPAEAGRTGDDTSPSACRCLAAVCCFIH